ncbi:hypothetical protein [Pseudomonas brassicacearum]|uniref:hypothetical protein n=1 Tax=Pseudomonas brassicacearum TaxID=930166 RepID=UPI00162071D7|nr:hypothetical protein [Pseudomonas brassicacearum]
MTEQRHLIPDGLQRASEEDRQYYLDAEQSLTEKEQALDERLRETKSLKAFVNFHAQEFVRAETNELIDPDKIFVNARHTFYVGQRAIRIPA